LLILLPPSETKRDGGTDDRLDLSSLGFPKLKTRRADLVRAVRALARDPLAAASALKLSPGLAAVEVERNRRLTLSPTMAVLDRYTGVVFDGLDAPSLPPAARAFALEHVGVHSALFGPVLAGDRIPAYRLSHDSRVPAVAASPVGATRPTVPVPPTGAAPSTGVAPSLGAAPSVGAASSVGAGPSVGAAPRMAPTLSLKKHWAGAVSAALSAHPGLLLDFRSEGYVALGPVDARPNSYFLRVFTVGPGGERRALNHFNKKAKGELTRALVLAGIDFAAVDDLIAWADSAGFDLRLSAPGELTLTV
jgi:cytoplasmic iron level regulating protein YaaA (DUF328/UPF0246 family)